MELEFVLDAEALPRLARIKALAVTREGRPRAGTARVVWHDSPDGTLRAASLALAEQRGAWQVELLSPGADTWLPAHAAPIVARATHLAELPDIPSPLAPVAAFEGRRSVSVHGLEAGAVTLTTARGVLRAVTAERAAARLYLSGEPLAVRAAMTLIATSVPLAVPLATLAAEGIALATGTSVPPRRLGAPRLPPRSPASEAALPVAEALRHILGHLLDVVLAHVPLAASDDERGIEAVHQMRVAVRRSRSALSLFRAILPPETHELLRDTLKTLNAHLGPRRDWDVFLGETIPTVRDGLPEQDPLLRLVAAAERQRRDHRQALSAFLDSAAFRALTLDLAWTIAAFPAPADPAPALAEFAGAVLGQRHRKLVSAGKRMEELDVAGLHDVRLRAKQVRYAAEMFATLHPGRPAQRFIKRLSLLQQRLGVLNDGAVAAGLLEQLGGAAGRHGYAAGVITGFLAARATRIRPRIIRAYARWKRNPPYWT